MSVLLQSAVFTRHIGGDTVSAHASTSTSALSTSKVRHTQPRLRSTPQASANTYSLQGPTHATAFTTEKVQAHPTRWQGPCHQALQHAARAACSTLLAVAMGMQILSSPLPALASPPDTSTIGASTVAALKPSTTLSAEPQSVRFTTARDAAALPAIPTTFPPLPPPRLPKYETVTLGNGLRLYLLEDHEVPLVYGSMLMRGGQYASPPDKVGLATLSALTQRGGGSVSHPQAALDARLEELAALVEVGAGQQAFSASFSCLAEDVREVVGLFAEVVRTPALPPSTLALYQGQVLNVLDHRNDDPSSVARRRLGQLLYGPGSVYARQPKAEVIQAISTQDVRSFLETWQRPDAAMLGIVGDFNSAAMAQLLQEAFGTWAPAPGQPAAPLPTPSTPLPSQEGVAGQVYLVDKPGATQASVVLGEPGTVLLDPMTPSLDVLGGVFNSFGGQLFDQVRSRDGLAYSVGGGWSSPIDHPGLFIAGGETSRPGELLVALRKVLETATQEAPTSKQVEAAKNEALNSFVFNFASSSSQLSRLLIYELLGLPQDYLFTYYNGLESVTRGSVLAAAQRWLHPAQQTVVVVADAQQAGADLAAAGLQYTVLPLD